MDGHNLLVLDFDKTMISPHTFQVLQELEAEYIKQGKALQAIDIQNFIIEKLNSKDFQIIQQEKLKELIEQVLDSGNFVAICSFTKYPDAIIAVLKYMKLSEDVINRIKIQAYLPHAEEQLIFGKNKHIIKVLEHGSLLSKIKKVVLVDDDRNNLIKLQSLTKDLTNLKVHAIEVDSKIEKSNHIELATEILNSLKDSNELPEAIDILNKMLPKDMQKMEWLIKESDGSLSMSKGVVAEAEIILLQRSRITIQNLLSRYGLDKESVNLVQSSRSGVNHILNISQDGLNVLTDLIVKDYRTILSEGKKLMEIIDLKFIIRIDDMSISLETPAPKDSLTEKFKELLALYPKAKDGEIVLRESNRGNGLFTIAISARALGELKDPDLKDPKRLGP